MKCDEIKYIIELDWLYNIKNFIRIYHVVLL